MLDQDPPVVVPPVGTGTHILVPVAYFHQLSACFYGNGPNYWELRRLTPPTPRTPQTPLERASREPEPDDGPELPIIDPEYLNMLRQAKPLLPQGVVPIGEAARMMSKVNNQAGNSGSPTRVKNAIKPDQSA